ncbi:MAG: hypothetical protein C4524_04535 [Candidatus Zixiibacteriota bacterium]|nr:MAG: hypothetical protein C4524_04535 [candidate division Zixibacteria bacterium]
MLNLAVYASAHGYGHASRSHEVARALVEMRPGTRVIFCSAAPPGFFTGETREGITYRSVSLDAGVRQRDSLSMDLPGTLDDLARLESQWEALAQAEAGFLRREGIGLVLADLPPLAFEAAARAGVPVCGLANFSWDWIYAGYAREYPAFRPHLRRIRRAYRHARILFRLPFAGRMDAFPRSEDVPLVARHSGLGREEARRRLGLPNGTPVALFSFGGFGLDLRRAGTAAGDLILITTDPSPDPGLPFLHLTDARLAALQLRYPDLVAAADAVVSKPGYGIVSECLANRTRLLYTPRGAFREYPVLVRQMKLRLPAREVSLEALAGGAWRDDFRRLCDLPFPPPPDTRGAEAVARRLLEFA